MIFGFELSVYAMDALRWAVIGFLFIAFMAWPLLLVMTPLQNRREGRIVALYSVLVFFAGSLFFATMLQPFFHVVTARQLYIIYTVLMGGLCIKGVFCALGGDRLLSRLSV